MFLVGSYPGESGRKLLIYISRAEKGLKYMSRGLRIAHFIARFCLESAFIGKRYSSKPLMVILRCLLVVFTCSTNS